MRNDRTAELELDSILVDLSNIIDEFEFQRKATEVGSLRWEILTAQIVKLKIARNRRIEELLSQ